MRVLFCKIRCPFICFCKPSSHLYTAGPLKLESGPHVPTTKVVSETDDKTVEGKDESAVDVNNRHEGENCRKSNLRKADSDGKEVQKKKVQWADFPGKELAEIREFEPSDRDTDDEANETRRCICVIL